MKNTLMCLVILLLGGSLSGMDAPPVVVYNDPLARVWIAECLFRLFPEKEAVDTLVSWARTDKASVNVLKSEIITGFLLERIKFCSYAYNRDEQMIAQPLKPLLSQAKYNAYLQNNALFDVFITIIKACAEKQDWEEAFILLKQLQGKALKDYFSFCLWKDNYLGSPAKKAVLNYAIELGSPNEFIKALIESGASLTGLPSQTPPPLLAACKKITDLKNPGISEDLEIISSAPLVELDDKGKCSLDQLKALLTLLVESGAKVTDDFVFLNQPNPIKSSISPIGWTILKQDKETLELLLKGKKLLLPNEFLLATVSFLSEDSVVKEELLKRVLEVSEKKDTQILFNVFSTSLHGILLNSNRVPNLVERVIKELSFLIDYGVDLNISIDGENNILDRAYDLKWDEKIIEFLTEKGAKKSSIELSDKAHKEKEFALVANDVYLRGVKGGPVSKEEICSVLKDAKIMLPTIVMRMFGICANENINPNELWGVSLESFFNMAMQVLSSQEAYEFLFFLETFKPLSFSYKGYGTITSVFHWIVASFNLIKVNHGQSIYDSEVKTKRDELCLLLTKLVQSGIKDDKTSEGKTAVERARELGLKEIADLIANAMNQATING